MTRFRSLLCVAATAMLLAGCASAGGRNADLLPGKWKAEVNNESVREQGCTVFVVEMTMTLEADGRVTEEATGRRECPNAAPVIEKHVETNRWSRSGERLTFHLEKLGFDQVYLWSISGNRLTLRPTVKDDFATSTFLRQ